MQNVTIRLEEDLVDELDLEADERSRNRSEYIRNLLKGRHESEVTQVEYDHLRARHDRLQDEHERLRSNHDILQAKHDRLERDYGQLQGDIARAREGVQRLESRIPEEVEIVPADQGEDSGIWASLRDRL